MSLPPDICFRSSGPIHDNDGEDDEDDNLGYLSGYQFQYQINDALVNVVVRSLIEAGQNELNTEDLLIDKLNDAQTTSPGEEDSLGIAEILRRSEEVIDEIERWITKVCGSTLMDILRTTIPRDEASPITVDQYIHPEIINIQVKTVNGEATVIRYYDTPPWPSNMNLGYPTGTKVQLIKNDKFPTYSSSGLTIIEKHAVPKVIIDGKVFRCKLNMSAYAAEREHDIYLKLMAAGLQSLHIPTFEGYVQDERDGKVIGMLLEDINVKHSILEEAMGDLSVSFVQSQHGLPSLERRRKWGNQIKDIVRQLHGNKILWGDVKPSNVVIDMEDDAWVLDFGGGTTPPWKALDERQNEENDWKAVELLVEYLETGLIPEILFADASTESIP